MKSFGSPSEQERVKQLLGKTGGPPLLIHPNTTITTPFFGVLSWVERSIAGDIAPSTATKRNVSPPPGSVLGPLLMHCTN